MLRVNSIPALKNRRLRDYCLLEAEETIRELFVGVTPSLSVASIAVQLILNTFCFIAAAFR